jgi:hypothetical protein
LHGKGSCGSEEYRKNSIPHPDHESFGMVLNPVLHGKLACGGRVLEHEEAIKLV